MGSQRGLIMVSGLVFLGWIFVWFLIPTKDYEVRWSPKLGTKLNSTYFQEQGTNFLLLSFPMMFISILGCVYLHLQNNSQKIQIKRDEKIQNSMAFLRRPVMVMAPFGIVTATEFLFGIMFIALMIWSFGHYIYVGFSYYVPMYLDPGEKLWQAKFRSVSLRLGYIGNICWAFLFFPVTRGSSILPLFGLTSESSIKYHIWLGHLSMTLFLGHTLGFIIYWGITHELVLMLEWSRDWCSNVAGEIAIVFAMAIWATSFPCVRRKMFEVFYYTHHLYVLYIFFYAIHVGVAYVCMTFPGIFLFIIDRYLRFLQSQRRARLVSARLLPGGSVELNFSKTPELIYNPASVMLVNIPSISKLQWHPFTVISNNNMDPHSLSVLIKNGGTWCDKLYKSLSSPLDRLEVSVEGPYGPSSCHFLSYESLIMVSGGSGIAPFISIIREMISQSTKPNTHLRLPPVTLICAFKTSADLTMLDLLLPISPTNSDLSGINLQIQAYVTRDKDPSPMASFENKLRTVWFKPNPLDSAISSVLGPNNWIWLAVIISSSFVLFLIFLGIVTRFYIYPYEKNSEKVYHFTYKVLWFMFLSCACVLMAASFVFLWCKTHMDSSRTEVSSVATPETSPGSTLKADGDGERELESLPLQSIAQASKVFYGCRPDLKTMILENKGSNIGVLVSGPREMRHDVAKICSSDSDDKLHFEAISFSW